MAVWTTVQASKKKPGGSGGAQEGSKTVAAVEDAQAGVPRRFTNKIRAEYVHSGRNGSFKASAEAKQMATHLFRIDPNIVFKSENDISIKFSNIADFPTGANKFKDFFTVTSHTRNDGSGKVHVNFLIDTNESLSSIKRDTTFMKYLRDRKIWMTEHKYETHEVKAIGYILNKSPTLTHRPQFEKELGSALNDYAEDKMDEDKFIPDMEINNKKIVHAIRDGNGKKTGVIETHALEIRCESAHATRLKALLCKANLPAHRFGKFVPYELAKDHPDVVKALIQEHNKLLTEIVAVPIYGLHENALHSLVTKVAENEDEDTVYNKVLEAEISFDEEGKESRREHIVLSIEQTMLSDESGKWFILTKKSNLVIAQNLIDEYLVPQAELTIAFQNHKNDNESFKLGIRRSNRPVDTAVQNYAAILKENMSKTTQLADSNVFDKYNYAKKRKPIQIEYDSAEFPELQKASKKAQQLKNGQQAKSTQDKKKTQINNQRSTSETQSSSSSSGSNSSDSMEAFKNAVRAQLDMMKLQMEELIERQEKREAKEKEDSNFQVEILKAIQVQMDFMTSQTARLDKIEDRATASEETANEHGATLQQILAQLQSNNKRLAEGTGAGKQTEKERSSTMDIDGNGGDPDDSAKRLKHNTPNEETQDGMEATLVTTASPRRND